MEKWTEKDFDKACDDATNETRKALAAQPKVNIIINSESPYWEGMINGHGIMIRTGESVSVPQDVAALIESNARVVRESEEKLKAYKSGSGKKVAEM